MALQVVVLGVQWIITARTRGEGGGGGGKGSISRRKGPAHSPPGSCFRRVGQRVHTAGAFAGSLITPLEAAWALATLSFPERELPLSVSLGLRGFPLSLDLLPRRRHWASFSNLQRKMTGSTSTWARDWAETVCPSQASRAVCEVLFPGPIVSPPHLTCLLVKIFFKVLFLLF